MEHWPLRPTLKLYVKVRRNWRKSPHTQRNISEWVSQYLPGLVSKECWKTPQETVVSEHKVSCPSEHSSRMTFLFAFTQLLWLPILPHYSLLRWRYEARMIPSPVWQLPASRGAEATTTWGCFSYELTRLKDEPRSFPSVLSLAKKKKKTTKEDKGKKKEYTASHFCNVSSGYCSQDVEVQR